MSIEPLSDNPIIAVGGVVYRFDPAGQIEILLIRKQYGYWTLPKGKVETGETTALALAREVQEETGITGNVGEYVHTVSYMVAKKGKPRPKVVTYYVFHAQGGTLRPDKKEHIVKLRWFSLRAALKRIKRGRVRKVVQRAIQVLLAAPLPG